MSLQKLCAPERPVYHYTTMPALAKILKEGFIRTANTQNGHEMPAVWFSENPDWEETVRKRIAVVSPRGTEQSPPLSRDALHRLGIRPVRLRADAWMLPLYPWRHHVRHGGITRSEIFALTAGALEWGANPDQWWLCYGIVPLLAVIRPFEEWDGRQWTENSCLPSEFVPPQSFSSAV